MNEETQTIDFRPAQDIEPGTFYRLLCEGYAGLLEAVPDFVEEYRAEWKKTDEAIFANPDSVGMCVLVSLFDGEPVGFFSWDPRKLPEKGEIGQNVVLPSTN